MNILIVDDDMELLDTTKSVLAKGGYEVATATNGLLALSEIKRKRPDLILADVLMPEMDGFTFYKELKNSSMTSDIPVLIITGRGAMEDTFKVMGVDGFIAKPFSPQDLMEEIEHVLLMAENKVQVKSTGKDIASKKVLAVGSEQFVLESMATHAKRAGYAFIPVQSGSDAISQVVKVYPDVVFVDVLLKDMGSGELVDILRRLPLMDKKPIIGYCYYAAEQLGDVKVRQEILRVNDLSNRIIQAGATAYMGRYSHQLFVKTIIEHVKA